MVVHQTGTEFYGMLPSIEASKELDISTPGA
jgi:hypothetical protein